MKHGRRRPPPPYSALQITLHGTVSGSSAKHLYPAAHAGDTRKTSTNMGSTIFFLYQPTVSCSSKARYLRRQVSPSSPRYL
jgi:hypothetical protein